MAGRCAVGKGAAVSVAVAGVLRRLAANGGDGVHLAVTCTNEDARRDLLADVRLAVACADEAAEAGAPGSDGVTATARAVVIALAHIDWRPGLEQWLRDLADALAAAGWAGTVGPVGLRWLPGWVQELGVARVTAHVAHGLDDLGWQYPAWGLSAPRTSTLARHAVDWGAFEGATTYFEEGLVSLQLPTDVSSELAAALHRSGSAGPTYVRRHPTRVRRVRCWPGGQVGYQVVDEANRWRQDVEDVRAAMLQLVDRLDLAIVRRSDRWVLGFEDLGSARPPLPLVEAAWFRIRRDLWDRYTPDAFGIQVLTRAHLDKATDLRGWRVEERAPGRFLVEANDLEPWFAGPVADPAVVDAARRDFGAVLLTDAVAKKPA